MSGPTGEQDWYVSGVFSMSFINLNDTFGDYIDRTGLVPKVNSAEDTLIPSDTKIDDHAGRHKDGGADELDVADLAGAKGISGQVPETDGVAVTWVNLAHGNLSGVSYNNHHSVGTGIIWDVSSNIAHSPASVHEAGGALEITHNNLSLGSDDHHAKYTDAEAIIAINNDADHSSTASHNYFSGSHLDLTDISSDDHHAKYTNAEAISAVEENSNIFVEKQEIKRSEDNVLLKLTDSDTINQLNYFLYSDGHFSIYGYRANDQTKFFFASFYPAAGYWEMGVIRGVDRAALKTSLGSVDTDSEIGDDLILPGGEYGFFPQIKTNDSTIEAAWGYNLHADIGERAFSTISTSYETGLTLAIANNTYRAYVQQRYITASGEIHWVFIKKDKSSGKFKSVWQAPDHPCFGNGSNPSKLAHPFGNFDPVKHELIVINPLSDQVREINRALLDSDGMENGLDFIEAMFELYDIIEDQTVKWPDIPVTVGLTSEYSDNPKKPVKKPVPACPYAKMGKLNVR